MNTDTVSRIVVYGADSGGVAVMDLALVCGWEVVRFVDDDRSAKELGIRELPVDAPESLLRRDFDLVVVSKMLDRSAVSARLDNMGFRHGSSFVFADEPVVMADMQISLNVAAPLRSGLRVVLFGTGQGGMVGRGLALERSWNVVYCVDNDSSRWSSRFGDRDIRSPDALRNRDFDLILVCSTPGRRAIVQRLAEMGFEHRVHYLDFREL